MRKEKKKKYVNASKRNVSKDMSKFVLKLLRKMAKQNKLADV